MNLFSGIFPGISAMKNLHPMVVHFPIALLSVFFIMELLGVVFGAEKLRTGASWMLYLGALGAIAAVSAGWLAESTVTHSEVVHAIMERHEAFGISVLVIAVILSAWRLRYAHTLSGSLRFVYLFIAFIMLLLMSFGADLGGLMVYKHGVSVNAVVQPPGHNHGRDHPHATETKTGPQRDAGATHGGHGEPGHAH